MPAAAVISSARRAIGGASRLRRNATPASAAKRMLRMEIEPEPVAVEGEEAEEGAEAPEGAAEGAPSSEAEAGQREGGQREADQG